MARDQRVSGPGPLAAAIGGVRSAFFAVAGLSGVLTVLSLSGSFFMLLVYDRVLPSRSLPTLVGLLVLVGVIYLFQALLEFTRSRILVEVGVAFETALSGRVFDISSQLPLRTPFADGQQPVRDLDQIRGFLTGAGPMALLDAPWIFLYLGICFAFHWMIGAAALTGAVILIGLTLMTELVTRAPSLVATRLAGQRAQFVLNSAANAEVIRAMGMTERMRDSWTTLSRDSLNGQRTAANFGGGLSSFTRVFRMFLQSAVLALGAYLVIEQKATGGIIIASSILTSRALAPVELAIANWKGFVSARQAWSRLNQLLLAAPQERPATALPAPSSSLSLEMVSIAPPGAQSFAVQDVTFSLQAGAGLGVIGPSGSGKSSLVRGLVGVWPPQRGIVRIDGAALEQWSVDSLGQHIGYLPQSVELITGTVAQNICRFDPFAMHADIITAAKAADVHDLIVRLPGGYDANVGVNGASLSAGQRQRIALARALYGDPFLLVFDEPNSNLDQDGEGALTRAIEGARKRGAIVVVVAHRQSALQALDQVMVLANGRVQTIGPKAEILAQLAGGSRKPPPPPTSPPGPRFNAPTTLR